MGCSNTKSNTSVLALFISIALPIGAHGGVFTLGPGLGVERVNELFNVDLNVVLGLYRFDNGTTAGAVVMFGYIDYLDVPDEERYGAIIGYSPSTANSKF